MSKSNGKGFMIGAAIGAALGVAGGLLFAPKKGDELRKDVKKSLKDYQKKAEVIIDDVSEKGREVSGDVVKAIQEQTSNKKITESIEAVSSVGRKIIEPVVNSFESKPSAITENRKKRVFKGIK
ncbi:YtxH domain-containing protein [bacterium]|uniref:YtxH domain-containing protein n=2 Tax=Katanobacteria TaxID=422282 RepID=A0A2M7X3T3_UNCKA|nr:YtxH domain-containing protein [bacterium]PIP56261.1 MAG: hypothetical protein COX05_03945 [candidate division WWE3 bacterium CG22_combo_CG10-13_8_21_14_all_39_12]PJA40832.1 MAG: hypothetical protein CO179_01260 [candidate division WWE3 bacterium CG_4_9_14_3_um_filter_39_7]